MLLVLTILSAAYATVLIVMVVRSRRRRFLRLAVALVLLGACAAALPTLRMGSYYQHSLALLRQGEWDRLSRVERICEENIHHVAYGQFMAERPDLLASTILKAQKAGWIAKDNLDQLVFYVDVYLGCESDPARSHIMCKAFLSSFPSRSYLLSVCFADWARSKGYVNDEMMFIEKAVQTLDAGCFPDLRSESLCAAIVLQRAGRASEAISLLRSAEKQNDSGKPLFAEPLAALEAGREYKFDHGFIRGDVCVPPDISKAIGNGAVP